MEKFYLIDKQIGISSFDIIRKLRKKINIKKMGHTGTLDPLATGLVLVATGNYTKLIPFLEKDKKTYITTINLDGTTASFDLAEKIEFLSEEKQEYFRKKITKKYLEEILQKNFLGKIKQTPPKFSAVKINGKRAYDLARDGKKFEIKSKKIEIFDIKIISYSYPKLELELEVSAGTYIRSIARDLGELLGTGGYLSSLRRIKIANLSLEDSFKLEDFLDKKDNSLSVKKIFDKKYFLEKDKNGSFNNGEITKEDIIRLNNGLVRNRKFSLEIGKNYFLYDKEKITNIIKFDGEKLIPVKNLFSL